MRVDHGIPFVFRHLVQHRRTSKPCIVHKNVQSPEILLRRSHHFFYFGFGSHVCTDGHGFSPHSPDCFDQFLRRSFTRSVVYEHISTFFGKGYGNVAPDPSAATGNYRSFAGQFHDTSSLASQSLAGLTRGSKLNREKTKKKAPRGTRGVKGGMDMGYRACVRSAHLTAWAAMMRNNVEIVRLRVSHNPCW